MWTIGARSEAHHCQRSASMNFNQTNLAELAAARRAREQQEPRPPLQWLDIASWDHVLVPERQWAIRDRVPLCQAGLFSGEGGAGKSILELTKDVAHVAGKDWLGSLPEPGPAIYIGAEDSADEI